MTARPIRTEPVIAIVWASPNWVQATPSGEMKAENLSPVRSTFTQYGAATAVGASLLEDSPPAASRRWKLAPLPSTAVLAIKAWVEPGSVFWRIITPAFAQVLLL